MSDWLNFIDTASDSIRVEEQAASADVDTTRPGLSTSNITVDDAMISEYLSSMSDEITLLEDRLSNSMDAIRPVQKKIQDAYNVYRQSKLRLAKSKSSDKARYGAMALFGVKTSPLSQNAEIDFNTSKEELANLLEPYVYHSEKAPYKYSPRDASLESAAERFLGLGAGNNFTIDDLFSQLQDYPAITKSNPLYDMRSDTEELSSLKNAYNELLGGE